MRVTTRIFCAVLAVAGAVAAVLVLVETVLQIAGRPAWVVDAHPLLDAAAGSAWAAPTVRLVAVAALVAGFVLLAVAWWPRPAVTIPVATRAGRAADDANDPVTVTLRRADLESYVADRLAELPFVTGADVTARADRVQVVAHSTRSDTTAVTESLTSTGRAVIEQFGLDPDVVRVRVVDSDRRAA